MEVLPVCVRDWGWALLGPWPVLEGGSAGGQTRALRSHERRFRGSERARGPAAPCSPGFALSGRPLQVTVVQPVPKATGRIVRDCTGSPLCDAAAAVEQGESGWPGWRKGAFRGFVFSILSVFEMQRPATAAWGLGVVI